MSLKEVGGEGGGRGSREGGRGEEEGGAKCVLLFASE